MEPAFLTLQEILEIHRDQIERYGGRPGVRDLEILKSAAAMPAAGIKDRYLHSDLFEMASAYLFHIIRDHPFVDGNKRTGAAAALVFLLLNGVSIDVNDDELEEIVRGVAEGRVEKAAVAEFLRTHGAQ